MKPHVLLVSNLSISPSPHLQSRVRKSVPLAKSLPTFAFLQRTSLIHFNSLRLCSRALDSTLKLVEAVRFDGPIMDNGIEDCELFVETCITRTLPPALTLEIGLNSIRETVEELKLNPPPASSGVLRFQVAVPPSPTAFSWFCSQPEASGVFPLFFLSKETENPSCKSLYLNRPRGVFGIGAAIYFMQSSSLTSGAHSFIKRHISSDSIRIATYGFMDIKFDEVSSSIKHEADSYYLLIPEIELDEHEDASILSATLAWDDALFRTFEQAIQSFELSINQASYHLWATGDRFCFDCIKSALYKISVMEDKTFQMVYANALSLGRRYSPADLLERVSPLS